MNNKDQDNLAEERASVMTTEDIMSTVESIEHQLEVESICKERGTKWVCSAVGAKRAFNKELATRGASEKESRKERSNKVALSAQNLNHERYLLHLSSGKAFADVFMKKVSKTIGGEAYKELIEETKEEMSRLYT